MFFFIIGRARVENGGIGRHAIIVEFGFLELARKTLFSSKIRKSMSSFSHISSHLCPNIKFFHPHFNSPFSICPFFFCHSKKFRAELDHHHRPLSCVMMSDWRCQNSEHRGENSLWGRRTNQMLISTDLEPKKKWSEEGDGDFHLPYRLCKRFISLFCSLSAFSGRRVRSNESKRTLRTHFRM